MDPSLEVAQSKATVIGQFRRQAFFVLRDNHFCFLDLQFQIMDFLHEKHIPTNRPIKNVNGRILIPFKHRTGLQGTYFTYLRKIKQYKIA